ncbi:MAG: tryptophan-rich sensory protein [Verrucomicrobiales bacterium]|nr:tryptophan-rich sensory protein [Verrucomicrobiales bacterium]
MSWMDWYNALQKPSWTPAPATIGRIWSILYPILFLTLAFVAVQIFRRRLPLSAGIPFALNLVSNLVFTPIQFGWRNLPLAAVDILVVWGTILWMITVLWRRHPWVAAAQIPYLAWVSTATVLQLSITWMNR